jgi:pilus assembly protein Flp/PilA
MERAEWQGYGAGATDTVSSPGKEVAPAMSFITALISSFRHDDDGQGLAEYALILALIAVVAIIALIFLGNQVSGILDNVGSTI